jgi:vancomycin resistance protein YoaR
VAVGGLTESELRAEVEQLAETTAARPVRVETPAAALDSSAGAMGVEVDQEATVQAALDAGRGALLARPFEWLGAVFRSHHVDVVYRVDSDALTTELAEMEAANRVDPVEPTILLTEGTIAAIPGVPGTGLALEPVPDQLIAAAQLESDPLVVVIETGPVAPTYSDEDVQAVAAEANELSSTPLTVTVDGQSTVVEPATLQTWMRAVPNGDETHLVLGMDQAQISTDVGAAVGAVGTPAVQLSWNVDAFGGVSYTEGSPGTGCCAPDSSQRVVDALTAGQTTVELDLTTEQPEHDAAWAESMQITTPISSFTTNHACCESRVTNIHRMADLLRGVVIEPGETFSINDTVGQRTRAKGFVEAGVIYNGRFEQDVGGGVSQFATTTFNAGFFGGLDLVEYMAHTIYISRYPYGREATLSYPSPDLKIRNNTPYGVLVWPTYTGTSITVTLYSTPWVSGEQTGQSESPAGRCTRVTTQRTRTWVSDGHQEVDTVTALYQPAEGVLC